MFSFFTRWFGGFSGGISKVPGTQSPDVETPIDTSTGQITVDQALQLSTVYACIDLYAKTIASLPIFVYQETADGGREKYRGSNLWTILHTRPNAYMTPSDFKATMVFNYLAYGNAYALIARASNGQVIALDPIAATQVNVVLDESGAVRYFYKWKDYGEAVECKPEDIVHWKGIGNGVLGKSRIDFMGATLREAINAQRNASQLFGAKSKPSAILHTDQVISDEQLPQLLKRFKSMVSGGGSLVVADRGLKYSQMSLSPQDAQLLETRQFVVEEICRWFGVPPSLVGSTAQTAWGTGIESTKTGFHSFSLAPMCSSFEEALSAKLLGFNEDLTIEFNYDALLRADPKTRAEVQSIQAQNGLATRNELRQLENRQPQEDGDELTVQSNLVPLKRLGKIAPNPNGGSADGSVIRQ